MNPSTALAATLVDELIRCGLTDAVLAPGSRSAPLAMELFRRAELGDLRLSVRIDERSAAFTAIGLAKVSRHPVVIVCTSGTAAAHFHAAVIEADESAVPLLVLTADRPPELRGTGANQTIDQLKLYGSAVRWFCELGVPEAEPQPGYWRSAAARAWGVASGAAGGTAGPVHLNVPLREPLVPTAESGEPGDSGEGAGLGGRAGDQPWTRFASVAEIGWTPRGLIVGGDGDYDPAPLLHLAADAGWPVLAEPSSNARTGPNALSAYQYLIGDPGFLAGHRPDVIVCAGRPGLSRGQTALLRAEGANRHVVLAQGPARWSDPARTATDVAEQVRLVGQRVAAPWLGSWLDADAAVRSAVDELLDAQEAMSEPRLARDLAAQLPDGALLWAASSLPIRDLDQHLRPRSGVRIVASRGASGIDGLVSSAIGAALAHQSAGGGQAVALLGDLALLHDAPGLILGPHEPRPDLCLVVANNDGGGIFSMLEQAAYPGPFERVFGTPHGTDLERLATLARLPYLRIEGPADLAAITAGGHGRGLMLAELRTQRPGQAALRTALTGAAGAALARLG
ncbi:MAG TPA: 2-succinyl-5-enolpyruvyl-6-hydroxy-3-cyclohexene-1-carboxylic-acid synthase [Streptosporangiaceae bacterium]|jgi:2-succinyl-5-enolpyruvyl-6-hydroxy-3-cyclohexene-1-carboxylate synthase|nr:2-succinyl-5-enolpyruvyl-6-hydroxy-3-cyclohexene-1-carboxylic-acid synthase [Streptosporangiaceae bacterium]